VGHVACVDASAEALAVARAGLASALNVSFHHASVDALPLPDDSQDFGYALGVLHHVPDPQSGLAACVRKLKPGAPFLVYLYYRLDDRPAWFRALWRVSDVLRRGVSGLPVASRIVVTNILAGIVYFPLARLARLGAWSGIDTASWPLRAYATRSFYTMRTDALDRFGTPLERRFTRAEVHDLMQRAGLDEILFNEEPPFWTAVGRRRARVVVS
jgi:SAM-dependent methyltransferase